MAHQDRTAAESRHVYHNAPHAHPEPVPHLLTKWDGHAPEFAHPHKHIVGGPSPYDHGVCDHRDLDDRPSDDQ